jgi:hypothetical protein
MASFGGKKNNKFIFSRQSEFAFPKRVVFRGQNQAGKLTATSLEKIVVFFFAVAAAAAAASDVIPVTSR